MVEKVNHCGIKVVVAVDPNKLNTDVNCFLSCSKLLLTESALHASFISGAVLDVGHVLSPCIATGLGEM